METMRKNEQYSKSQMAGKKAWEESIRPSEYGYIQELAKKLGIGEECIFHHDGVPDLFVITPQGKLKFYEMKPKEGAQKRTKLNDLQKETIRKLLKNESVEVYVVKYEKKPGIVYGEPEELTESNLEDY